MEIASPRSIGELRAPSMPAGFRERWGFPAIKPALLAVALVAAAGSGPSLEAKTNPPSTAPASTITVGERTAADLARDIVARPLPNGCVPNSMVFLSKYLAENPREAGELVIIDLKDGKAEGHALAMYSKNGKVGFFDHELGQVETKLDARTSPSKLRDGIREVYLQKMQRTKEAIAKGFLEAPRASKETSLEASRRAVEWLGKEKMATLVRFEVDGREQYAAAFGADGKVWVYSPEQGAASAAATPGAGYGQLISTALKAQYPGASKMGVVRDTATIVASK